jgi:meso-butanediol dehydrogenase/(S,S)-butanediol dehydrogenase/diacetyl reductase
MEDQPGGLAGRTVLVTGAASGIGRAIALGAHGDGAVVIAADIDEVGLKAVAGDRLVPCVTDVADEAQVRAAVELAIAETGRLDALVNNAGVAGRGRIETLEPGTFEHTMAVHTFGAVYAMHAAIPHLRAQARGRIVNVLSRGAEIATPDGVAYSAAKAALFAVTRAAARELAGTGILVNGLIPGPTNTAIWGADRPELQAPEVVYPHVRSLLELPDDGPTGAVFWNGEPYRLFHPDGNGGRGAVTR